MYRAKIISFLLVLRIISPIFCQTSSTPVDLEAKYGQEGTVFGDGKSCYRDCDGNPKICYYKFRAENYNTMGARCEDCAQNVTSDCFNFQCIIGNGFPRNVMTINRQIPGPTISTCWNDEVIIDVENRISGAVLAIHWHGLHHVNTPWMDGVPMLTQCPIVAGNTFRYRFHAEQVGTHYWHAHTGLQRADGIFGRFIVRQPKATDPNGDLYDFDENQHLLLITDWTNSMSGEFSPGLPQKPIRVDSVLINGIGCHTNVEEKETNCDVIPVPTFYMQHGKSFRWRIDNSAAQNCPLEFTILGQNMTVVATDGFSVEPRTIENLVSMSGERYDVVVYAQNNRLIKESYIRIRAIGTCTRHKIQAFGRIIYVEDQLNYETSFSDARPYADHPAYDEPFKQNAIGLNHPLTDCGVGEHLCVADLQQKGIVSPSGGNLREVKPDREFTFKFSVVFSELEPSTFLAVGTKSLIARINNIVSTSPPVPGLTQDDSFVPYCNASDFNNAESKDGLHFCPHLIQLKLNEVVDFLLIDEGFSTQVSHPFHLHGYGFQVIAMGSRNQLGTSPYSNETSLPNIKDTIAIPGGGFARIRFRASNPGYWYFHCHFEWHMHVGMKAIIRVGDKSQMKTPPPGFPTCGNYLPPLYES